jgi:hypothetical protein
MIRFLGVMLALAVLPSLPAQAQDPGPDRPAALLPPPANPDLVALHAELQDYMVPRFTTGVVLVSGGRIGEDYSDALMARKLAGLARFEQRLAAMPVRQWPEAQQVDWFVVKSLLNGYRFNLEVLRPWRRDPGFYLDPLMQVAFTELPASGEALTRLQDQLKAVPPMLASARATLRDVPADFADLAIRNLERSDGVNHYHPVRDTPPPGILGWYDDLLARARASQPDLVPLAQAARDSVVGFRDWLKRERPRMTARAGVGPARLQWYLTHVRMVPYSTAEMLALAQREHERLSAALALRRHRNRDVPQIAISTSRAEQEAKVAAVDAQVREFLRREQILTVPADIGPLRANAPFIARAEGPNFWERIQWRDPIPDHLHATIPGHGFDGAMARRDTHPIRARYADGVRVEGWAMYLEEAMPLAGALEGHSPRAAEFIDIFGIFRATRVPADIHMQHNRWTVAQAVDHMRGMTPWLDEDVARVDAEIYLRRPPGYGLSYLIGKLQVEALLAEQARRLGDRFRLRDFHDRFLAAGRLPVALIRYEMTGDPAAVQPFWRTPPIPAAN